MFLFSEFNVKYLIKQFSVLVIGRLYKVVMAIILEHSISCIDKYVEADYRYDSAREILHLEVGGMLENSEKLENLLVTSFNTTLFSSVFLCFIKKTKVIFFVDNVMSSFLSFRYFSGSIVISLDK